MCSHNAPTVTSYGLCRSEQRAVFTYSLRPLPSDRKKNYGILWRRVPHLDTTKWTELCISFRTITHSNYGKKERKQKQNKKKNLKIKKSKRQKVSQIFQLFRGNCKNVNFNTWNRSQPIITQTLPRKKGERANVHACVRACARMCVEVMAMVVIAVGIQKRSCEEDMGLKILLLTNSPL
jgi:hypothetical protein